MKLLLIIICFGIRRRGEEEEGAEELVVDEVS